MDQIRGHRRLVVGLAAVQVGLMAAALTDIAIRDPRSLTRRKSFWCAVSCVNVVGPLAYFRWGPRRLT